MNILLINPPRSNGLCVIREDRCEITERESIFPPYSLAQIAALLRKNGHKVDLIDANCLDLSVEDVKSLISGKNELDAVIFRFTPTTLMDDMKIALISKQIDLNICTIAMCWTLRDFAEDVLKKTENLDVYVVGEPLTTIPDLINSLGSGIEQLPGIVFRNGTEVIKNKVSGISFDYNSIPMPAYDLLPSLDNYYLRTKPGNPYTTIHTSKGCPYGCIYCTVAGTKWNPRSADTVFEEIKSLYDKHGVKSISFFDETFTHDRERVVDICNRIIDENIKIEWYCNTRANKVDFELLKLMKTAGCQGMSLGIESGSQKLLDNARKGTTIEQNREAIKLAKKAGIKTYCSFMFGLPGENWDTVRETIDFVKDTLPNGAQFNVVVPYPGTKLFDFAIEKNWISNDIDWTRLYQHISTMQTDDLSTLELEKARKMAYKSLYFNPKWVFMNMMWIMKNPSDFSLAAKYYVKSLANYLVHGMEHAH